MTIAIGVFGSLIGSFLNVVIYRVPAGRSIVAPASMCGACGHEIRWFDNIPVLSWLLLRANCRDCGVHVSARYPLVELGTALFFVAVTLAFLPPVLSSPTPSAAVGGTLTLVAYLYLAAITVALAMIDLDVHRLPNSLVLPAYAVGAVLLTAAALIAGDIGRLASAGVGALALFGLYLLLALVFPGGMGFGDVKLAGVLGLFLGWLGVSPLLVGAFAAFLLGGLFAIGLLLAKRVDGKSGIPFGPWMLLGAWVGILAGVPIADAYLHLFGLGS